METDSRIGRRETARERRRMGVQESVWLSGIATIVVLAVVVLVIRRARLRAEAEQARRPPPLQVRPLSASSRDRYTQAWESLQPRFEPEPEVTIREADRLIQNVMGEWGYPSGDFGRVPAELSDAQLDVLEQYRVAHRIAVKSETTMLADEEVQRAVSAFRALFEILVAS
jgi:hypothetical protein